MKYNGGASGGTTKTLHGHLASDGGVSGFRVDADRSLHMPEMIYRPWSTIIGIVARVYLHPAIHIHQCVET
ncbi:MAG: hypothetical protein JXR40_11890 [Pontiellaceae bacterium]|nr:hypothetical protein [Pontiellaceae bacterium]